MSRAKIAVASIWAGLHASQYGLAITSLNGIQDAVTCELRGASLKSGKGAKLLSPCISMSSTQFGIVVAILSVGGLIGSASSDILTRKIGRIGVLRLAACLVLLGSAVTGLSRSAAVMIVGRILVGIASGLSTVTVPLFLSEIAPSRFQRALGILHQLFIVLGMLLGQALSLPFAKLTQWRYVFLISVCLAAFQLLASFAIGGIIGDRGEADKDPDQQDEESPLLERDEEEPLSVTDLIMSKDTALRRAVLVVIVAQISQQICGVSPVMFFSTRILKPVFAGNSRLIALAVVAAKVPLTVAPAFVIERIGSRPILLFSSCIMTASALGLAFGLNFESRIASGIAIASYVSSFSVGLGPVSWVVISEVVPPHARTAAGAIGISCNWIMTFIMGASFSPLQELLSQGKKDQEGNIFFIFAATCALAFIATKISFSAYDRAKQ